MCCSVTSRCLGITLAASGLTLLLGIIVASTRNPIFNEILQKSLSIVPGTPMFPNWQDLPVPVHTSIYFFNVTNAHDVEHKMAVPKLEEVGPYVYLEQHHKTKLAFNDENGTVTYQQIRTWHFVPEMTNGTEDDIIVTLNAPAIGVNAVAAKSSAIVKFVISAALGLIKEPLFVAKPVRELTFKGYKDPVLTDSKALPDKYVPVRLDRFGYFYPRNGSDWFDGVFNMYTGAKDLSKLGQVYSWNYTHHTKFYPDKCGEVRGAGDFFSPHQTDTYVELYSNDLCRPMRLDFDSAGKRDGVYGNSYKISKNFFANKTDYPGNWCYNPENEIPSGLFNASSCRYGSPTFLSQPHFYQADPWYLTQAEGLKPNKTRHESEFFVEPSSGLPVTVTARFQVNFLVENLPTVGLFKNIRTQYFPTCWFETKTRISGLMDEEIALLSNLRMILLITGLVLIGGGISWGVIYVVFYFNKHARERCEGDAPILNQSLFQEDEEENRT